MLTIKTQLTGDVLRRCDSHQRREAAVVRSRVLAASPKSSRQHLPFNPTTRNSGVLNLLESKTYITRGDVATATDERGFASVFSYDAERHLVTTTTPAPFSYLTAVTYDKNGRATETRAKTGNAANPEQVQTTVYSKSDNPLAVIDSEGNVTSFAYDDADRLIQTTDAEGRITQEDHAVENLIPTPITESELLIGRPRFIKFCL